MIEVKNLCFSYPGSRRRVFDGLDLELKENAVYGLLGRNGMGKSTLLYLICGLLTPRGGSVNVDGHEPRRREPSLLREIFIVPEEYSLPAVRLSEYVKTTAPFYPRFSQQLMDDCLREFGMEGDPMLDALSMGQRKKVFMSFAFATGTRYLIMDEPTNGLDIPSKAQFRKVVARSMADDRTMIISTHQVHDVDALLDHIIILDESQVLLNASVGEICEKYVFEYRTPDDMADAIYAEPTLQGNAVMAERGEKAETPLNLELLFNALTQRKN